MIFEGFDKDREHMFSFDYNQMEGRRNSEYRQRLDD
jgi:hypothetical protein